MQEQNSDGNWSRLGQRVGVRPSGGYRAGMTRHFASTMVLFLNSMIGRRCFCVE